jgi:ferredoxin-fold anticodon binding domain-containing protein
MNISRQNRRAVAQRMLIRKKRVIINKRMETRKKMFEAAKKFIGKKSVIYTFNSDYITGVVKEVTDGAVIVDRKGKEEIVNLDFIVRIKDASDNK